MARKVAVTAQILGSNFCISVIFKTHEVELFLRYLALPPVPAVLVGLYLVCKVQGQPEVGLGPWSRNVNM